MKQILATLMLGTVLAGCGTSTSQDTLTESPSAKQEQPVSLEKTSAYVPNPQLPDDRRLTKINQTVTDDKGDLTLKQFKPVNETRKIGPIEMTIEEIKVFHARPSYGMIDFFHGFTHEEFFDLIKTRVTITNTSDTPVTFNPVAHFKLNGEAEKTLEDDVYLESLAKTYAPSETRSGNFGFILERPVKSIELLTSDVLDEKQDVLKKGTTYSTFLR
ncbi:hypothetical protein [uncultured Exiguobacterium sp.]|uniref:DUF4352 domain-containing protein n=1 Tax=uncultured Exiguobacterium sp. TaxID=202669 RepID=UPI0025F7D653|nr:hypothetical protein [uncultured Exiguobacterium sp.]